MRPVPYRLEYSTVLTSSQRVFPVYARKLLFWYESKRVLELEDLRWVISSEFARKRSIQRAVCVSLYDVTKVLSSGVLILVLPSTAVTNTGNGFEQEQVACVLLFCDCAIILENTVRRRLPSGQ